MIPIRDTIPSRRTPVVTWTLIAVNTAVFLCELMLGPVLLERLTYLLGVIPARYTHPEWALQIGLPAYDPLPLITSMFLHGSLLHLIGNMWMLWLFGDNVEDRMGPLRFLVFYLLVGIAAGLTHIFAHPDSVIPTIGASGAIAGVLGAYFFLFPRARIIAWLPVFFLPFFLELPAVTYLLFWLLIQVFSGTLSGLQPQQGGVAWWAHVGGFVAGALIHRAFILSGDRRPRRMQSDEYGLEGAWS